MTIEFDLATQVASMGQWVGQVWEYALSDKVRVTSSPCWGKGYRNPCQGRPVEDADCPYCHGLGWTASKDLAVLEAVVFARWPNAHIEHHVYGTALETWRWQAVNIASDNCPTLWDCVRQVLEVEGYTVHPDVEKVGQTP